jgi:hypothetical protein
LRSLSSHRDQIGSRWRALQSAARRSWCGCASGCNEQSGIPESAEASHGERVFVSFLLVAMHVSVPGHGRCQDGGCAWAGVDAKGMGPVDVRHDLAVLDRLAVEASPPADPARALLGLLNESRGDEASGLDSPTSSR